MKSKGDLLLFILPKDKMTLLQLLQVREESRNVKIIDRIVIIDGPNLENKAFVYALWRIQF